MSVWLYDFERRIAWQRRRRVLIVLLLAFLAVLLLDRTLFNALVVAPVPARPSENDPALMARYLEAQQHYEGAVQELERRDFYRTFRVAGTLWPWLLICGALLAHALASRPRTRGLAGAAVMIFASAAIAGIAAEALRVVFGRLRPNAPDPPGTHQFKGLLERFQDPSNLAFPSSHAAVAFGAAFMVAFVYPRAGAVALLVALGCGVTRMVSGAHFASDVFGAAVLGYAIVRLVRPGGWAGLRRRPLLP